MLMHADFVLYGSLLSAVADQQAHCTLIDLLRILAHDFRTWPSILTKIVSTLQDALAAWS